MNQYKKRIEQLEKERTNLLRTKKVEQPTMPGGMPGWGEAFEPLTFGEALTDVERRLGKARSELVALPAPEDIGSLAEEGAIVESPMMSGLRMFAGAASAATIRATRELAYPTEDEKKPVEEFGYFEYKPSQVNPLVPAEGENGLSNTEAAIAAVATMPMFFELTSNFPAMQATPAAIYTTGTLATVADVVMPIGPEAVGIALAPMTGGGSIAGVVAIKGAKVAAKTARVATKTKQLNTAIEAFDMAEDAIRTFQAGGLNKVPGYAQQVIAKNAAVAQANRLLAQAEAPKIGATERAAEVLNPFSTPQTIRGRAAAALADTMQPVLDDAIALRVGDDAAKAARVVEMETAGGARKRLAQEYSSKQDIGKAYKAFIDEEIKSLGARAGKAADPAILAALRVSSGIVDVLTTEGKGTKIYGDLFNRTYAARILSKNTALRSTIKDSLQAGQTIDQIDNILAQTPFDADAFRAAANDTLRTQADNALYNRAPSNDVFFTSRLLIDRRTAENLDFLDAVTKQKRKFYEGLTPQKVFQEADRERVALAVIRELGTDTIKNSVELQTILTKVVKGEALDDAAFRVVDDAFTTQIAKHEIKNFRRGVGREAPLTTERGFARATATERERFALPRSLADIKERLGLQQGLLTNKDLAKSMSGIRGAINKARKTRPTLTPQTPTALRFAGAELDDIGNSVFEATAQRLKAAARAGTAPQEVNALVSEAVDSSQKVAKDQFETLQRQLIEAGSSRGAAAEEAAIKFGYLPDNYKLEDLGAALGREATQEDIAEFVLTTINKTAISSFVKGYLDDFFEYVSTRELAIRNHNFSRISGELAEKLARSKAPLSFEDLENAIGDARALSPGLRSRGLAKGVMTSTDATLEAALARTISTTSAAKGQQLLARVIDINPQLRIDLIDTPTSNLTIAPINTASAKNALFEDMMRLFDFLDPHATRALKGQQDAIEATFETALTQLQTRYNNPIITQRLLTTMTEALLQRGLHGLKPIIAAENNILLRAGKSMESAYGRAIAAAQKGMREVSTAEIKAEVTALDELTKRQRAAYNAATEAERKRILKLYGEDIKKLRARYTITDQIKADAEKAAQAPDPDMFQDLAAKDKSYMKTLSKIEELTQLEKEFSAAQVEDEFALRQYEVSGQKEELSRLREEFKYDQYQEELEAVQKEYKRIHLANIKEEEAWRAAEEARLAEYEARLAEYEASIQPLRAAQEEEQALQAIESDYQQALKEWEANEKIKAEELIEFEKKQAEWLKLETGRAFRLQYIREYDRPAKLHALYQDLEELSERKTKAIAKAEKFTKEYTAVDDELSKLNKQLSDIQAEYKTARDKAEQKLKAFRKKYPVAGNADDANSDQFVRNALMQAGKNALATPKSIEALIKLQKPITLIEQTIRTARDEFIQLTSRKRTAQLKREAKAAGRSFLKKDLPEWPEAMTKGEKDLQAAKATFDKAIAKRKDDALFKKMETLFIKEEKVKEALEKVDQFEVKEKRHAARSQAYTPIRQELEKIQSDLRWKTKKYDELYSRVAKKLKKPDTPNYPWTDMSQALYNMGYKPKVVPPSLKPSAKPVKPVLPTKLEIKEAAAPSAFGDVPPNAKHGKAYNEEDIVLPAPYGADIGKELPISAFRGTSFEAETRALNVLVDYNNSLLGFRRELVNKAKEAGANIDDVEPIFNKYKAAYTKHYKAWLQSRAGTVSSMIAGGSGFPAKRMRKKMDIADKRNQEAITSEKKQRSIALKAVDQITVKAQGGEIAVAKKEIDKLKEESTQMKKLNRIVKKKNQSKEDKIAELMKAGPLKRKNAESLLQPDYMGKLGFPAHMLTAKRKKIKYLENKIKKLEAAAPPPPPKTGPIKLPPKPIRPDPIPKPIPEEYPQAPTTVEKPRERGPAPEAPTPTAIPLTPKQIKLRAKLADEMIAHQQRINAKIQKKKVQAYIKDIKERHKAEKPKAIEERKKLKEEEIKDVIEGRRAEKAEKEAGRKYYRTTLKETAQAEEKQIREGVAAQMRERLAGEQFNQRLEMFSPVHQLRNSLLGALDDYGIPYMRNSADARAVADEMGSVIDAVDPLPFALVYGREFGDTIAKAKKNFKAPSVQRALEGYGVRDQGFARALLDLVENMRKVMVQGLLGGFGTFRYAGVNALSAPFMMAATRGFGGTAADLGAGLYYYTKKLRSKPEDIAFTDIKGRPWTFAEVEAAQQRHPLSASQTAAELDTSNLKFLTELMQKGKHLYKFSPLAARSYVGRFADYTDRMLRQAVFVHGLERGLTEPQAARDAKDALFDYQRARESKVNRSIGQAILFWSFQSESLRALADVMWRDPGQIVNTYRLVRKGQEKNDQLASGGNMDQARIFRERITGFDRQQNVVGGFPLPALESFGMAAEGMSMVMMPALYDDVELSEAILRQTDILTNRASFRPAIKFGLKLMEKKGFGGKEGQFVPNVYTSGMPEGIWSTYRDVFDIVPVPPEERKAGKASRFGEQWRFKSKKAETSHLLFQQLLFSAGLQRRAEDLLKSSAIAIEPTAQRIPYPFGEKHTLLESVIYETGWQTYLSARPPEQQLEIQKARVKQELKTRR